MLVCAGELGADLIGVGVLQVLEDRHRLLPGLPGLRQFAGQVAGVADSGESAGFAEPVAAFPEQGESTLVAVGGFGAVPQMELGAPEAISDMCLEPVVADFGAQGKCRPDTGAAPAHRVRARRRSGPLLRLAR